MLGKKEMISAIFHGELGNNIFQLAALLALKDEMGISYEIINKRDSWVSSFRPLEIKNIFATEFNFVDDYTQNYRLYHHTDLNPHTTNYSFAYRPIPKVNDIIIRGYFQSEKYFANIKTKLVEEYFKPKQEIVNYIISKYGHMLANSVAIHVRAGGDRPSCHDLFPLLTQDYYKKAIDICSSKKRLDNILVFSDNMSVAKQILPNTYTFIENESNIVDLIFMSMCSNIIIGNSTFSWWSAYLNKNSDKVVVAPNTNWFGGHLAVLDRSDLFPEFWITL
jgi:hypothetical protein